MLAYVVNLKAPLPAYRQAGLQGHARLAEEGLGVVMW